MKSNVYLIAAVCLLLPCLSWGQCAPPSPSCSGCSPLTADNQNLSSGTYCISTTVSNINILPGAVVCISAPGSIVNGNLSGGTLIYNGGTLTNFNANSGDLRIQGALTNTASTGLNGARVIVENGGSLSKTDLDVNWSLVVDGGTVDISNLFRINGNGSVCLSNTGQIHTQYLQNNSTNGTTAQSTKGCISISNPQGQTNLNNILTNTSNVFVCLPGSFTPSNLGSATTATNCTNCTTALPVTYAYFRAQPLQKGVQLEWQTTNELRHSHFIVERSINAIDFQSVSGPVIDPFGTRNDTKVYRYIDGEVSQGTFYYRLKQVDTDGSFAYSKLVAVNLGDQNAAVRLFPNPVVDQLQIRFDTEEMGIVDVELSDLSGKEWLSQSGNKTEKSHMQQLNVQSLPKGFYLVTIRLGNQYFIRKLLK
ncbi:T9SS type A sorting domain-containing protein [Larkinella rosea]|uniref:T9SS C-terminal target domain-containing protein n=1 Tax=Larkinella rosea TaxID=2025312 RepID=A0A3P1C105_9BACT|nr:T9SS type A sorting domain-containing protein [Larkinella rosea]RRB06942.1 T9SS C-terminal target domain-containing protein [Larkinella rosea]